MKTLLDQYRINVIDSDHPDGANRDYGDASSGKAA